MSMKTKVNIMWFRRDLRVTDNAALYHALRSDLPVVPVFIFDRNILSQLERTDRRVTFIYDAVAEMQRGIAKAGSCIDIYHDTPTGAFTEILGKYDVNAVYTNRDYEPYARERDLALEKLLAANGAAFHTYKDHVIFDRDEVLKDDGTPYTVFTPYSKRWKAALTPFFLSSYPAEKYYGNFLQRGTGSFPALESIGFEKSSDMFPAKRIPDDVIRHYSERRDYPGLTHGTSRMGVHLRFGTVSIRELARHAQQLNETYLNELIWREFYQMILWHFPKVGKGQSFKAAYDRIPWQNNEAHFERWCNGTTGYPIVDAGMRELNATGFMHNRVRMITASFLVKHLLIDWRWGEAYFSAKLLDYDLAANNGGWQWAAGSGCDAAPYFRVFNPYLQTEKFDKKLEYVKKWVPEFQEFSYPEPIVVHEEARKRALEVYGEAVGGRDGTRV